jgi:hypothetical protein
MPKSESRPNSIVVEFVEEPFMAPEMETPQTFVESAESPATGCAIPNLFGNVDEATQNYAVHGPPCQLWLVPCLVWPAFPEVQQDQKVQKTGDNTPTDLGTFEQSQRLWQASCRPSVQPQLAPPEIVAEQREALRAQHQQVLLALEPVVAERAAEEAKEAKEAEPALENVEPQTPQAEPVEVPSLLSSGSELPRASSTLNGKAPKFRPGMEAQLCGRCVWHVCLARVFGTCVCVWVGHVCGTCVACKRKIDLGSGSYRFMLVDSEPVCLWQLF